MLVLVTALAHATDGDKAYGGFVSITNNYGTIQANFKLPLIALDISHNASEQLKNGDKPSLTDLQNYFLDLGKVMIFPQKAHCELKGLELSSTEPMTVSAAVKMQSTEEQLTLLKVNYSISCNTPRHLRQIHFSLLSRHPRLQKLEVSLDSNGTKRESVLASTRALLLLR